MKYCLKKLKLKYSFHPCHPLLKILLIWLIKKLDLYTETIKEIANEFGLQYLPFRENLKATMPEKSDQIEDYAQSVTLIRKAGLKKNILGQSWNEISRSRKAKYLTDNIHLNDDGAEILAKLIDIELIKFEKNGK